MVRRLGDGTAISTWSYEPREGLVVCIAKAVPPSLSYFKTLSIGPRNRTPDLPLCRPAGYGELEELSHGKNIKIKFCLCLQGAKS